MPKRPAKPYCRECRQYHEAHHTLPPEKSHSEITRERIGATRAARNARQSAIGERTKADAELTKDVRGAYRRATAPDPRNRLATSREANELRRASREAKYERRTAEAVREKYKARGRPK